MKTLWAPWRMEYILGKKEPECIFCSYPKKTNDRDNLILYRSAHNFVMMNKYPYNNGHIMVVPYIHTSTIDNLTDEVLLDFMKVTQYSLKCLKEAFRPEGFNIGINIGAVAGAGMEEHVHLHMVPRWAGDTSFMSVLGEIKVIPEYIMETYDKLFPVFNKR
ncbi:MAG: HIT family hydrolase [Nitrospirae bacterium GWF2_44_13]|nr:MAG: HIT family hydrolase [Nitrospirae bacterium GWF2_44_13]OGW32934.1 MAG: HIT family hydrolase [Nitrospirae bacterium GWD2_44_7]OGW64569.1 MAG: HIT family hydrolase [Nitrospirae bacterium RIFOXYA2_FULL_44_9]HBG93144.1 HIT family hydrolase [Nitrospiraceae bacterium]